MPTFRISFPTEYSYNDLHHAACKGQLKKVEELLDRKGIELDALSPKGETPLYLAACNGHLKVVQCLHEAGADKDIPNGAGQTPLFEACSRGREDVALYLIEQGANIEKANPKRACPLLMAAESGSDVVVKALIAKGADKNQANQWSQTPLFTAVQRNHPRVVKTLVECGADVNRFDYKGYTPLAVAVERGFVDIAVYLMREGKADLRARTNDLITKQGRRVVARGPGDLPIDLAKKCNRPEAMKQAILDEEEYRKSGKSGKIRADGETTEPAAKKQRLSEKQQSEEAGDISTID